MSEPPRTDLDIAAERCVEVIRYWQDRPLDASSDLRLIAHFAWALGLEPLVSLRPIKRRDEEEKTDE